MGTCHKMERRGVYDEVDAVSDAQVNQLQAEVDELVRGGDSDEVVAGDGRQAQRVLVTAERLRIWDALGSQVLRNGSLPSS